VGDGTIASCSCGGGASTGAGTAAPGHEFDSTINQAIGDGITGRLKPGDAVGFTVLGVLGNALLAPKTTTNDVPDPAVQQRLLAAHQLNERGIYLLKQKNYEGAINEFQQALAITPGDTTISNNLGIARQMQKNAAQAGQNSEALGQLLGSLQETAGNSSSPLNLVNLGPDASVVDLRNAGGATVDPATLKGQIDSVFSNSGQSQTTADSQGAVPQAQDIDKLFQSPQTAPSATASGSVGSFNARCAGAAQGSAADAACQQDQAQQIDARQKQVSDLFKDPDLKDAPNDLNATPPAGSNTPGGGNQPSAGGQTNFFGSPNSVTPGNAGLVDPAAAPKVSIKSTTDALTSASGSGAAANAGGISNEAGSIQAGHVFDTAPVAPPTAIPINKGAPQAPSAEQQLAAQIPAAAMADPKIQNAIQNELGYYGNLDAQRLATQNRLDQIQQQINSGNGNLGLQQQQLQTNLKQYSTDEAGAKSQIQAILVNNNYKVNWDEAPAPATANPSQSANGSTTGSTPQ
jgi:hypothetical protein